jgi:hypothetical protein
MQEPGGVVGAIPGRAETGRWQRTLPWLAAAALAFPLAPLVHELGHMAGYALAGVSGIRLHYGSVSVESGKRFTDLLDRGDLAGAAATIPFWKVAIGSAGGLLVSYALIAACVLLARRWRPHPFVIAFGLISNTRFASVLVPLYLHLSGQPVRGPDEARLARVTAIPFPVIALVSLAFLVLGSVLLIRAIPLGTRLVALAAMALGATVSGVIYANLLGPWLLP